MFPFIRQISGSNGKWEQNFCGGGANWQINQSVNEAAGLFGAVTFYCQMNQYNGPLIVSGKESNDECGSDCTANVCPSHDFLSITNGSWETGTVDTQVDAYFHKPDNVSYVTRFSGDWYQHATGNGTNADLVFGVSKEHSDIDLLFPAVGNDGISIVIG